MTPHETPRRPPLSRLCRAALAYLGLLVVVWALGRGVAEGHWLSTLLLYTPQVLYAIPLLLLLPAAALMRDRLAALAVLLAAGFTAGPLMGLEVAFPTRVPESAPRVRVLAFNIRGLTRGRERVRTEVERFRPDVAVLSESRGWGDDRRMEADLREMFPGFECRLAGDLFLASRWPVTRSESRRLSSYEEGLPRPQRERLTVWVEHPQGRFSVTGVHFRTAMTGETLLRSLKRRRLPAYLTGTGRVRTGQVRELTPFLRSLEGPAVLAGDFNTPPAGRVYGALRREMDDAFDRAGIGWGFTYPAGVPLLRIDYVFHSRHWTPTAARVGSGEASDHRPVFAELALTRP